MVCSVFGTVCPYSLIPPSIQPDEMGAIPICTHWGYRLESNLIKFGVRQTGLKRNNQGRSCDLCPPFKLNLKDLS